MIKVIIPMMLFSVSSMGILLISDAKPAQAVTTGAALLNANQVLCGSGQQASPFVPVVHNPRDHVHKNLEVSSLSAIPSVSIVVTEDASKKGWNLHIKPKNFHFAPAHINQPNVNNEGHSHLYIDGKMISRVYGNWYFINKLQPGCHQVILTLNSNDHQQLVNNGKPIAASTTICQGAVAS